MNIFHLYVLLAMGWVTALALNISRTRMREGIGLGDGGNLALKKAIRAHINALEHCLPFGFILFALSDLEASETVLGGLVAAFLLGRVAHAVSLFASLGNLRRISASAVYGCEVVALGWLATKLL